MGNNMLSESGNIVFSFSLVIVFSKPVTYSLKYSEKQMCMHLPISDWWNLPSSLYQLGASDPTEEQYPKPVIQGWKILLIH